jgi:hypothetical protein
VKALPVMAHPKSAEGIAAVAQLTATLQQHDPSQLVSLVQLQQESSSKSSQPAAAAAADGSVGSSSSSSSSSSSAADVGSLWVVCIHTLHALLNGLSQSGSGRELAAAGEAGRSTMFALKGDRHQD